MRFDKGQGYKLHEMNDALVITASSTTVANGKPLCLADAPTLLVYLDRYFYERENGKSRLDAHSLALSSAQITEIKP